MPLHLRRYGQEGYLHFITFGCHRRLPYLNTAAVYTCFERWLDPFAPRARRLTWVKRTVYLLMAVRQGFGRYTSADSVQVEKRSPLRGDQTVPFGDGGRVFTPQIEIIYAPRRVMRRIECA